MFEKFTNSFLKDFNFSELLLKFRRNRFLFYSKGEIIYSTNDIISNIFFILSGNIEIISCQIFGFTENPVKYSSGEILSLSDILTGNYYSGSALAKTNVNILSIEKNEFLKLLNRNDEFNLWTLKYISTRLDMNGSPF